MTVATDICETQFIGNGVTTTWDITWPSSSKAALILWKEDVDTESYEAVDPAEFDVTYNEDNTCTINYPNSGSPLSSSYRLLVSRSEDYTQTTSIRNQRAFYPAAIEEGLDHQAKLIGQLKRDFERLKNRTFRLAALDAGTLTSFGNFTTRANKVAGFDSNGNAALFSTSASYGMLATWLADGLMTKEDRAWIDLWKVANPCEPQFGATGDGVTNDVAGIQAAIDYLAGSTGILIINHTHYTDSEVVISTDSSLTIYCPNTYGGKILSGHTGSAIRTSFSKVGVAAALRIENLNISRKAGGANGGTALEIVFNDLESGSFKGIELLGLSISRDGSTFFTNGISLTRCTHATIERCFIQGQGGTGTTKVGSAVNLNTWCQGLTVHNNKMRGFLNGLLIDDLSVDVAEDFQSEGYSVRGNTVSNCEYGIKSTLSATEVSWLIQANSFDCTRAGVDLDNILRTQIIDNRFGWNGGHTDHVDVRLRRTSEGVEAAATLQSIVAHNRSFRKGDLELLITGVTRGVTTTLLYSTVSKTRMITAISKTNPCVITYSGGDAFDEDDTTSLSDIVGMTELNGYSGRIQNVNTAANTFELVGVDSSAFTTYISGGTVTLSSANGVLAENDIVYLYGIGGTTELNSIPVKVTSLNTGARTFVAKTYQTDAHIDSSTYAAFSSNGTLTRYGRFIEVKGGADIDIAANQIAFRNVGAHLWPNVKNVLWANNRLIGKDGSSVIDNINESYNPTTLMMLPFGAAVFSRTLREFGAKPDNTDNTAYIQAAIDWSSVTGGTITDGDPGTYTCLSQINMKDNASLVFGPQTRFEGAFDGDLVGQEDDNVAVENFRILGGEWGKDATSRRRNIFKLNMNRSVISGAVLKTFGKGKAIGFVGDSNLITGCQILDPVNDTGSGGIRCTGGRHNTISNCYAESGDDLFQLVPSVNGAVNVITAITNANPGVATYSGADNLTNGQTYYITGGKGMTELNGQAVVVANVNTATNTFELQGVNTTSYGVYTGNAIISNSAWDNRDIDDCHFIGCTGVVLYARACNAGLDAREYSGVKIVSISKANPGVVVTDVAHGYTNGQIVRHFDTNGMIELEDVDCTITVVSPTSYSIGVNTTTYGTYTDPANPDDRGYVINYDLTTMSASIRNCSFSHIRVRSEGRIAIKSVNFDSLGEINGLTFNDVTVDMRDAPVTYPDGRVNNKSAIYMANQKNLSLRDVRITGTPARLFTISSVDGLRMDNVGSDDVARNLSHTGSVARLFSCKDAVLDRLYIAATPYKNALSIDAGDGDDKDEYDTNDTDPVTNCDIRGLKITGMTDGNTAGGVNAAIVCQDGTDIRINGLDIRKSTDAAYAAYLTNIRAMTVTAPTDAALKSRVVVTGGDVNECSATNKFSLPSAHFCLVKNVRGWVTEANGTGTINNGSTTSGNVSHGLSRTPNAAQIALVITSSSAGTAGPPWIGTVDATKFIASVPTTPTTNMSFSWRIDASEYL